jgi:hypothetical protein
MPEMTSGGQWLRMLHLNDYIISGQNIRQFQVAPVAPDSRCRSQKQLVAPTRATKTSRCMSTGKRVTQQGAPAHVTRKRAANETVIPRGEKVPFFRGLVVNPSSPNQVYVAKELKRAF